MIFFAAGDWSTEYYLKVCMELNISKLWSYYHERSRIEKSEKSPPYQWYLIDSGAFSYNLMGMNKIFPLNIKPIEKYAEDYHAAIENCERKDFLFVELDACFHFTEKQLTNIANRFRERRHYLRVYHPMADGGTLEIVRKWIDEGWTYIAVANDGLDYLDALFSITRDKIKVHGFAMTKTKILDRYPFYSVDSTTPLSTVRYGHRVLKSRGLHSNGFLVTKHDAIEMRLANVLNNNETRIRTALQEFKKLEQYYTELWKARGITWPATPWETNNG